MEVQPLGSAALHIPQEVQTDLPQKLLDRFGAQAEALLHQINPSGEQPILALIPFGSSVAGTAVEGSDTDYFFLIDEVPQHAQYPILDSRLHDWPIGFTRLVNISKGNSDGDRFNELCFALFLLTPVYTQSTAEHVYAKRKELVANLHALGRDGEAVWQHISEIVYQDIIRYEDTIETQQKRSQRRDEVARSLHKTTEEWSFLRSEITLPTVQQLYEAYCLS